MTSAPIIIMPSNPDLAGLLQPEIGDGSIPCDRSLWKTIISWTYHDWQQMVMTSKPFEAWPECRCHRCIDRDFLLYIGKCVQLTGFHGYGLIVDVYEFQADMVMFKVVGKKVMTENETAYLLAPRRFVSLDPVDQFRYFLYRTWYPVRCLLWGEIPAHTFHFKPRDEAATLFP